jgi:dTDP-L-rhamnose 4-epimerase
MEKREANYEVFNVGNGKSVSINDVAQVLIKLSGKKITPTVTGKYRAGDIRHCVADITKIKNTLGYNPEVTLEKGMRELIQWGETAFALDKTDDAQRELAAKRLIL